MPKRCLMLSCALLVLGVAQAQDASDPDASAQTAARLEPANGQSQAADGEAPPRAEPAAEPGVKTLSGMSILGNEEAPTSLVIVPWKSSQIGDEVGVANAIDERARPVDKEVFMREVHYYELRSSRDGPVQ